MSLLLARIAAAHRSGGGGGGDPYFANVVALLHMDGTNGSTTFTDVTGKTWTANDNAQIATAQSKFGGASAAFDGTNDWIQTGDSADWNFGSGDLTIEAWCYRNASSDIPVFSQDTPGTGANLFRFLYRNDLSAWYLIVHPWGGTSRIIPFADASVPTATWFHAALTIESGLIRVFRDGVQQASFDASTYGALPDLSANAYIGRTRYSVERYMNGYIDELRVTKGVARYTANFAPPTDPFPDS